ncbi:class I SAM-dependent methyltransferase [Knoellia sp. CPCC 206450]|uniref:class I SAM-dependent methyltransferase n=1 Tax=Knoellia tibetensis TaxID=3404798 RepID=UPI003B4300DF
MAARGTEPRRWQQEADRLAQASIERGDPTSWFEELYAAGEAGEVTMAWDHDDPQPLLAAWLREHGVRGEGRTAVVVGCGLGADAEHVASLGFQTTAFDLSPTAIRTALGRHPDTKVDYRAADLFDLPEGWRQAFDLVVDVYTVQALPRELRERTVGAIADLVAPGGTLVAVQGVLPPDDDGSGPPWLLTGDDVALFAGHGLSEVEVVADGSLTDYPCWRAVLAR